MRISIPSRPRLFPKVLVVRFSGYLLFALLFCSLSPPLRAQAHILDLNNRQVIPLEQMIRDLKESQVVFIGESHDLLSHHQVQLQVIRELYESGEDVAIGLEMFRKDGQDELDRWVAGETDGAHFVSIFQDHWDSWPVYRDIFLYARDKRIPLVGLNISREIVNRVARHGFAALPEEVRAGLPLATCNVSAGYRAFLRGVLSKHPLDETAYEHFCEAQILWDASMAENLAAYLQNYPLKTVVVLAGNGHAWKQGISEHLDRYGHFHQRVLLPEVPGWLEHERINEKMSDYLLMGVGEGPLH